MAATLEMGSPYDVTVAVTLPVQYPRQWTNFQRKKHLMRFLLRRGQWKANWRHKW